VAIFVNYIEANTVLDNILLSLDINRFYWNTGDKFFWEKILCITATVALLFSHTTCR